MVGTVTDPRLSEISGIGFDADGTLWAHNDSGDAATLYGLALDGTVTRTVNLDADVFDAEDLAVGLGPDGDRNVPYLADIGDNLGIRRSLAIHRVDDLATGAVTTWFVRYPDGRHDAEGFLVDPRTGDGYLFTKTADAPTRVYRLDAAATPGTIVTLELVTELDLGAAVTGADISPGGDVIALRGYQAVWLFHRTGDEPLADALSLPPCLAPNPPERQGEAIAWDPAGGYVTISEGANPPVHHVGP